MTVEGRLYTNREIDQRGEDQRTEGGSKDRGEDQMTEGKIKGQRGRSKDRGEDQRTEGKQQLKILLIGIGIFSH